MFKRYAKLMFLFGLAILVVAVVLSFHQPKRYAVFAGYNPDGTIHPYVITYLKGLNEVADGVVYVADSILKPEEEEKLKPLTIHYENVRHEEYDFGSYKRGFNWLKNNGYLEKADELILANDSCYAPITSFKPMFKAMDKRKDLDFWGDLRNIVFGWHIQSYFLVFRKKVFNTAEFEVFLDFVLHQKHKMDYVIQYEVQLTRKLEKSGYKWGTYMPYDDMEMLLGYDKTFYPLTLAKAYGHQFIKKHVFSGDVAIVEKVNELLQYLKVTSPTTYRDIIYDLSPKLLLTDLSKSTIFAAYVMSLIGYGG